MWINDDTTWNLTAQRHKLSSDVMQLSSLGESHCGEKNITDIITGFNISRLRQRPVTEEFYL